MQHHVSNMVSNEAHHDSGTLDINTRVDKALDTCWASRSETGEYAMPGYVSCIMTEAQRKMDT